MRYLQKQLFYGDILFGVLTLILGTLLHFVYEWSGNNYLVGLFAPVNESTWEHLKLLFFPVVFVSIFEYCQVGRFFASFITARTIGCFSGMAFIVVFFYTYTGIIGHSFLWLDISTFFLSTGLCFCLSYYLTTRKKAGNRRRNFLSVCLLLFVAFLFFRYTNRPPDIHLFQSSAETLKFFSD